MKAAHRLFSKLFCRLLGAALALWVPGTAGAAPVQLSVTTIVTEAQRVLVPATLGVLVNKNDPNSLPLARRYAALRGIPTTNIVPLDLPVADDVSKDDMKRVVRELQDNPLYPRLVAFALAFQKPFRVAGNQSITSAISDGVSDLVWDRICLGATAENPDRLIHVFNFPGRADPLKAKPAMMLVGGKTYSDSDALLMRGLRADNTDPTGQLYLMKTTDAARSRPRETWMQLAATAFGEGGVGLGVTFEENNHLAHRNDVFVFQTGLAKIPDLNTLTFKPGAYADHLTSVGGVLFGANDQTPITALMQAGATASYGTVREPCNYTSKFPNPYAVLIRYWWGDTILEAYWRSLNWTTEGVFVGEPLARPFPTMIATWDGTTVTFTANTRTSRFFETTYDPATGKTTKALKVYQVQSGEPVFLGTLSLPDDARITAGTALGTLNLAVSPTTAQPILAVLVP